MVDNQNILPIASVKKQNVKSAKNAGAQIIRSCICIKCHLYVLYFLAWIFTIWLLFMCLWNSHENDVRGDLYNTFSKKTNIDKESCDGKGIGIHTNMYLDEVKKSHLLFSEFFYFLHCFFLSIKPSNPYVT
jgi:hypothetical protein